MTAEQQENRERVTDIVGVGFGPANLALAVAVAEHNRSHPATEGVSSTFLERKSGFGWHQGMLLEGATMQVSFLKDLATLRNPLSDFSFLSYLHSRDRLVDFVNHKTLFPSRLEFHDYLEWTAARLADQVRYSSEMTEVRPVVRDGRVELLDVVTRTEAGTTTHRTRNLVLGTGLVPSLPDGVIASDRVWHSSELLIRLDKRTEPAGRFVVVGAGQSAAEVAGYLHERFRDTQVHAVFARYGYSPADDSPFANGVFDPSAVDLYYAASPAVKQTFFEYHANTNYSVVDLELIEELYRRAYQERVTGRQRLHIEHMSRVSQVRTRSSSVQVDIEFLPTGGSHTVDADVVVYATGYREMDPNALLDGIGGLCKFDGTGRPRVERDYQVSTAADVRCGIYLQGGTESTHGLSSSLLSNAAVRAGEVLTSILGAREEGIHHARS